MFGLPVPVPFVTMAFGATTAPADVQQLAQVSYVQCRLETVPSASKDTGVAIAITNVTKIVNHATKLPASADFANLAFTAKTVTIHVRRTATVAVRNTLECVTFVQKVITVSSVNMSANVIPLRVAIDTVGIVHIAVVGIGE